MRDSGLRQADEEVDAEPGHGGQPLKNPIYRGGVSFPPVDLTVADGASHPPLGTALVEIKPR